MECWKKTEEFDKFYKSVQAAHLTLLSTKYKIDIDTERSDQNVTVKDESADAIIDSSSEYDHAEENSASKHEEDDFGQDNGKYICKV